MKHCQPPRYYLFWILLLCLASPVTIADGFVVVGLHEDSGQWRLYIKDGGAAWRHIPTEDEPRTPVFHGASRQLVYADSLGNIRRISDSADTVVLQAGDDATFTQPDFASSNAGIYLVALKNGASVDTDILYGDLATGKSRITVAQRSAQFEPYWHNGLLYYSSVSCVPPSCHRIIEDIWKIDPLTRQALQLTRLNAISREPIVDSNDDSLYFISDVNGSFRLYRGSGDDASPLTSDGGIHSSPGITRDGDVIYILRSRNQSDRLRRWVKGTSAVTDIPAPPNVIKLRDFSTWR